MIIGSTGRTCNIRKIFLRYQNQPSSGLWFTYYSSDILPKLNWLIYGSIMAKPSIFIIDNLHYKIIVVLASTSVSHIVSSWNWHFQCILVMRNTYIKCEVPEVKLVLVYYVVFNLLVIIYIYFFYTMSEYFSTEWPDDYLLVA